MRQGLIPTRASSNLQINVPGWFKRAVGDVPFAATHLTPLHSPKETFGGRPVRVPF
jgi:hypothetical protein